MGNFNKVILMGNLTRDPQLRYLPNNNPVCDFGLAVNRRWRDRDGNQREEVCYVDLTAFGRQGETINQYMSKGRPILVEGRLKFDTWTGQDGQKRSKHSVVVENFRFIGSRDEAAPNSASAEERAPSGYQQSGGYERSRSASTAPGCGAQPEAPEPPLPDASPPSGDNIPF